MILQNFTDLHFGLSKYNPSIAYSEGAFLDMNCGEYFKKLKAYTNTINREIESYEKKK